MQTATTTSPVEQAPDHPNELRTSNDPAVIARCLRDHLRYDLATFPQVATRNNLYMALAQTVRDRLLHRWVNTAQSYLERESRTVCYLSAEFLMGPQLGNNLINLGLEQEVREALQLESLDLEQLAEQEEEPGLGNGGLGRLAACFLDSMATLEIPSIGYGIRYEFGIFHQDIRDGWQIERTDKWLRFGNPWEIARPEIVLNVMFGGRTETIEDDFGRLEIRWIPDRVVRGMAYDTPVAGHRANTANLLRLWKAEAVESFDFQAFNTGDYYGAVGQKMASENITKVLYPNDSKPEGKILRLEQQYFFASCALQDMIRIYQQKSSDLKRFHEKYVIQLNDTHPAIAVVELMRLLLDEHQFSWDDAWQVTQNTFAYTNHTLLPEALECWPVSLFGRVLPRHLELIYEINRRFLDEVDEIFPDDPALLNRLSIIDEAGERSVRMANLACVGSKAINGVAEIHSDLLRTTVLRDFYELWPDKFFNVTNGVTPRRFLRLSNPGLSALISSRIGHGWVKDLSNLRELEFLTEDAGFQEEWQLVKRNSKEQLAKLIQERTGVKVDPASLFDFQVKRMHEYKRQHLNVLHIVALYHRLRLNPNLDVTPRTFLFGGKAAPGYHQAKLMIKLIHAVGEAVNRDPMVRDRLKVVFFPNFNVKNAQAIYPAGDLSEQISTAGKEASGTGNMKFAMNGALTIGTLDGANIEIRDQVGAENFFLFGLTEKEVRDLKASGYRPRDHYEQDEELRTCLDMISSGFFSPERPDLFKPLVDSLLEHDEYMLLADFRSYLECQDEVSRTYQDQAAWTRKSILNVARSGHFSSDRAIAEYCQNIWEVSAEPIG